MNQGPLSLEYLLFGSLFLSLELPGVSLEHHRHRTEAQGQGRGLISPDNVYGQMCSTLMSVQSYVVHPDDHNLEI